LVSLSEGETEIEGPSVEKHSVSSLSRAKRGGRNVLKVKLVCWPECVTGKMVKLSLLLAMYEAMKLYEGVEIGRHVLAGTRWR
jgi:hypothetical protein